MVCGEHKALNALSHCHIFPQVVLMKGGVIADFFTVLNSYGGAWRAGFVLSKIDAELA